MCVVNCNYRDETKIKRAIERTETLVILTYTTSIRIYTAQVNGAHDINGNRKKKVPVEKVPHWEKKSRRKRSHTRKK